MKYSIHLIFYTLISLSSIGILCSPVQAQLWHNKERILHYQPSGNDFLLHKGTKKFNRALYGTNTAFRVETGDLPEFALYMPGMDGNCKIGILYKDQSKWLTEAGSIQTVYRPGSMLYEIKDPLLQNGVIRLTSLAMADADGMIIKIEAKQVPAGLSVVIAYGAATGKKFSRDGDIGADPESSFYMQPAYCKDNIYVVAKNRFRLNYGFTRPLSEEERYEIQYGHKKPDTTAKEQPKELKGTFPVTATVKLADAEQQATPKSLWASSAKSKTPVITALIPTNGNSEHYFFVESNSKIRLYNQAATIFSQAEKARKVIAERIVLETPDEYINPLGGALAIAADAIWETPSFLHGAVAWRMRLPAWRGAYAADALGWQDRARLHFDSYLKSQVNHITPGLVEPDTALHFARQKERMGNAMFSNGYICRQPDGKMQPHHYDMNLVFIDQLLTHLKYTGDIAYIKKVWPSIQLHLQWEKRNFDADDDGLYDAYACIWASDALQYSGGGVTHSTAYNYRANKMAAQIAKQIGEDGSRYEKEANKILRAMNQKLWSREVGTFAEYKDLDGLQLLHTSPGLWTIYHAIDGETATPQQQYQMLRYVDHHIPHVPVSAKGLPFRDLYLLATTNWQPYTWSINNVALAENLHTSLAYWQSGESNKAFHLWKSAIVESMYLSSCPGGFQQLSFYDAVRGELYRDFADPIGVAARTLTEGLFGIKPDALNNQLLVQPGFPQHWKFAKLGTPNISFDFKEEENTSTYRIIPRYNKPMNLVLRINALKDRVAAVHVNGKKTACNWKEALRIPVIEINAGAQQSYTIRITWTGNAIEGTGDLITSVIHETAQLSFPIAKAGTVTDPQQAFTQVSVQPGAIKFSGAKEGRHPLLINLRQGDASWTAPVMVHIKPSVEIKTTDERTKNAAGISVTNNSSTVKKGTIIVNSFKKAVSIAPASSQTIDIPAAQLVKGTNKVTIQWQDGTSSYSAITNWEAAATGNYEAIDISQALNDQVTHTFRHQYLSPRPATTTLQIPWQGIGNWCYPLIQPEISDEGIKGKEAIYLDKIPFKIGAVKNIAYTSQWDNFPESIRIPLSGRSRHAWLLMAGTTNHQQSQMANGIIYIEYRDDTKDSLPLINPENWWPIEQDYMNDGFAFKSSPKPYRLIFKTGTFTRNFNDYSTIKGFTNMAIEGGAGTVLDIPLDADKELRSLTLKTLANEVVTGIMSLTLERP
ncbi:DUF4450 domain-containing protein [Niabella aquatica]